jgi:arginine-tRNA-protein transferase
LSKLCYAEPDGESWQPSNEQINNTPSDTAKEEGQIRLFKTTEHPCSYLPDRSAQTIFVEPEAEKDPVLYQSLIDLGFRRSGSEIYRPDCPVCRVCIPARIPVDRFVPKRSQRRTWKRMQNNLQITLSPAEFKQEHFELYAKYINSRHPDGEMANPDPEDYHRFLIAPWCDSSFVEFRNGAGLIAVAVIDLLPQGISAVYTFFDPELSHLSPGVLTILWQIQETKRLGLPWLYLGYWVPGCRKMQYKQEYRPIQVYSSGEWTEFHTDTSITIPELSE